jgi:hypothetical protein
VRDNHLRFVGKVDLDCFGRDRACLSLAVSMVGPLGRLCVNSKLYLFLNSRNDRPGYGRDRAGVCELGYRNELHVGVGVSDDGLGFELPSATNGLSVVSKLYEACER